MRTDKQTKTKQEKRKDNEIQNNVGQKKLNKPNRIELLGPKHSATYPMQ